jgi:hypothetical protein
MVWIMAIWTVEVKVDARMPSGRVRFLSGPTGGHSISGSDAIRRQTGGVAEAYAFAYWVTGSVS